MKGTKNLVPFFNIYLKKIEMVHSYFDHKDNILITKFYDDVFAKEIIEYINSVRLNKEYPRTLKILTDSKQSNMVLDMENVHTVLQEIVDANNESLKVYDYICDAIVLENPNDTAISYLYQEMSVAKNYFFKLFYTFDAAKRWLRLC